MEKIVTGDLQTNCYLLWDSETKDCLVVDPGDDGVDIAGMISDKFLVPRGILASHGHFDHVLGALDIKLIFDIPFYCHSSDMFLLERQQATARHFLKKEIKVPNFRHIDVDLCVTKNIMLGSAEIKVIDTPGHTPGSVCFFIEDENILLSGDTLFKGGRGETSHSYSNTKDIYKSINKLVSLDENTLVYPGHGEDTSIGIEKALYL